MTERMYPYKVSASIITYNQVKFIEKAIDSILEQEVDFPYEIIIGDDCSTDGTREILKDYKQRYPEQIKLHLHDEHYDGIPGRLNNITNIRSAQGKYIAFCDGDDYWISKNKLQRQVDFMDANPDYSFSCHNAWEFRDGKFRKSVSQKFYAFRKDNTFSFTDIAQKKFHIPSVSLLMRSSFIQNLPDWFWDVYTADLALQFIASQQGPVKYFKDIVAAYRIHEKNISKKYFSGKNHLEILKNDIKVYNEQFPSTKKYFLNRHSEYYLIESTYYFNKSRYLKSFTQLMKSIYYDRRSFYQALLKIHSRVRQQFINPEPPNATV